MIFEAEIETFQGPLDLLLQLIQNEELEITEIALAQVAEQYLQFIQEVSLSPSQITDFLMIAAELILIKSKVLLPSLEPEEGEPTSEELQQRLRIYQDIQKQAEKLRTDAEVCTQLIVRSWPVQRVPEFSEPEEITGKELFFFFQKSIEREEEQKQKLTIQKRHENYIPLEKKIEELQTQIQKRLSLRFSSLRTSSSTRQEVIVSFLAILELIKKQMIVVTQQHHRADIYIQHHGE